MVLCDYEAYCAVLYGCPDAASPRLCRANDQVGRKPHVALSADSRLLAIGTSAKRSCRRSSLGSWEFRAHLPQEVGRRREEPRLMRCRRQRKRFVHDAKCLSGGAGTEWSPAGGRRSAGVAPPIPPTHWHIPEFRAALPHLPPC